MKNQGEYLYGLIFTILVFLLMDQFASGVSLLIRVMIILLLVMIGRLLLKRLFYDKEEK